MQKKRKYPYFLSIVLLLVYIATAEYSNSSPNLPGLFPFKLADPVLIPRFITAGLVSFVLCMFLLCSKKASGKLPFSGIAFIYLLLIAAYFISIPFAINEKEAWFKAIFELQFFLSFVILLAYLNAMNNPMVQLSRALLPVVIIHVLVLILQLYAALIQGDFDHTTSYKLIALMAHRNLAAQVSLLFVPFAIFLWRKSLSVVKKIGLSLLIVFLIGFSFISYSRAIWGGIVLMIGISLFLLLIRGRFWVSIKKTLFWQGAIVSFVLLVGLFVYLGINKPKIIKDQLHFFENPYYGSAMERLNLWDFTLQDIQKYPMGIGGGNWKIHAMKYDVSSVRENQTPGTEVYFQRPHNDFLWTWSETGYAGFILFVMLFAWAGFTALRRYLKTTDKSLAIQYSGVIILLSLFALFSFFSFPAGRPFLKLMFLFVLIPAGLSNRHKILPVKGSLVLFLLVQMAVWGVAAASLRSAVYDRKMQEARINGEKESVIQNGKKAINFISDLDEVATPFSWYVSEAYLNKGELRKAERLLLDAYDSNPEHVHVLNNLGVLSMEKQRLNLARGYFKHALKNKPGFDQCRLNYALCLFELHHHRQAIEQIRIIGDEKLAGQLRDKILPAYTYSISSHVNDEQVKKAIINIYKQPDWMKSVFEKSRKNQRSFRHQLILDALYSMKKDSIIKQEEYEYLHSCLITGDKKE